MVKYYCLQELKCHWRRNKSRAFRDLNNDITGYRAKLKALGYEHFMKCFKPARDIAFTKEHNMAGWRIEGMIPFTRHALWKKVEGDEVIAYNSNTPGFLPSSTPSPAVVAALDSNTGLLTPGGMPTTNPLDPSTLSPIPFRI